MPRADMEKQKRSKTAIVVGNGKLSRDLSVIVDAADFVVRFNEPKLSIGMSGTRTDLLVLATASKPMQRRLSDPDFVLSPTFRAAARVMLAYHPSIIQKYHPRPNILSRLKGRRADWTARTIDVVGSAGKEILIMPPQFYVDGCGELGLSEAQMHKAFPSTGYFGLRHVLQTHSPDEWEVQLCGFSWEGWKRHAWMNERQWVADRMVEGRLDMID